VKQKSHLQKWYGQASNAHKQNICMLIKVH